MNEEQDASAIKLPIVKGKGGQKAKFLTQDDLADLARLSKTCTQGQIAAYFGMCHTTFIEVKKRQPEIDKIYKRGRVIAGAHIASKLYEAADSGNIAAMFFYLKTQFGYKEKGESELDTDNELEHDKNPKVYVEFIEPKDNMKEVAEVSNE